MQLSIEQRQKRVALIQATAEAMGWPLEAGAIALMVTDTADKTDAQIDAALKTIRTEGRGRLTLQKIVAALPATEPTVPASRRLTGGEDDFQSRMASQRSLTPGMDLHDFPPMDNEAVVEAGRRIAVGRNRHVWAALWDIEAERADRGGAFVRTDEASLPVAREMREIDIDQPFRKNLPPNPNVKQVGQAVPGRDPGMSEDAVRAELARQAEGAF